MLTPDANFLDALRKRAGQATGAGPSALPFAPKDKSIQGPMGIGDPMGAAPSRPPAFGPPGQPLVVGPPGQSTVNVGGPSLPTATGPTIPPTPPNVALDSGLPGGPSAGYDYRPTQQRLAQLLMQRLMSGQEQQ